MKKKCFILTAAAMMALCGCGTMGTTGSDGGLGTLGSVLGDVLTNGQTIGNVIQSVIGTSTKVSRENLMRSWTYSQPGCAFTSEKLLAQAGGEVVAAEVKQKLAPTYQTMGIKPSNTTILFNNDGTFAATFAGRNMTGTWTYDEATNKVTLQTLLLSINCYAKRNSDGIALLFESSKLLTLLQAMSALSGNAQLQAVGEIAKSYDGLRLGFDFK